MPSCRVQAAFQRSLADRERLRRLSRTHALDVPQQDGGSVVGREPAQGTLDGGEELARLDSILGPRVPVGYPLADIIEELEGFLV